MSPCKLKPLSVKACLTSGGEPCRPRPGHRCERRWEHHPSAQGRCGPPHRRGADSAGAQSLGTSAHCASVRSVKPSAATERCNTQRHDRKHSVPAQPRRYARTQQHVNIRGVPSLPGSRMPPCCSATRNRRWFLLFSHRFPPRACRAGLSRFVRTVSRRRCSVSV